MIYTDLEGIFENTGVENKYALAMIVAVRARQLSERKGGFLSGEGSERCITYAIEEIEANHLNVVPGKSGEDAVCDAPGVA